MKQLVDMSSQGTMGGIDMDIPQSVENTEAFVGESLLQVPLVTGGA